MTYTFLLSALLLTFSPVTWAEKRSIQLPAPPKEAISAAVDLVYCDGFMEATLWPTAKQGVEANLTAEIADVQTRRTVLEVTDESLYVHTRWNFDNGQLAWAREFPLRIVKRGDSNLLVAFGFDKGPRNTSVSFFSLNRTTGVALFTTSQGTIFAEDGSAAKGFGGSSATYMKCGVRRQ